MAEEMDRDKNVFVIGEEVARYNGAYKVSQLLRRFRIRELGSDDRHALYRPCGQVGWDLNG
jgi:hypothetical protein